MINCVKLYNDLIFLMEIKIIVIVLALADGS